MTDLNSSLANKKKTSNIDLVRKVLIGIIGFSTLLVALYAYQYLVIKPYNKTLAGNEKLEVGRPIQEDTARSDKQSTEGLLRRYHIASFAYRIKTKLNDNSSYTPELNKLKDFIDEKTYDTLTKLLVDLNLDFNSYYIKISQIPMMHKDTFLIRIRKIEEAKQQDSIEWMQYNVLDAIESRDEPEILHFLESNDFNNVVFNELRELIKRREAARKFLDNLINESLS